ncbi:MAG: DUF378 domain-containing protein [Oscillospiraceae bacterium]|jgi:uncharacterized membrane protein YuzA (DUF378 family)|nr:DUF378 domain-containing protein [Oscillospiraceae bacterium]
MIDRIALVLVIIGALCLGSMGLFGFNFLSMIFGGQTAVTTKIVYTLIGIAGLWSVTLLFRERHPVDDRID